MHNSFLPLQLTLYNALQSARSPPTELYATSVPAPRLNPRDAYLSLRSSGPAQTQKLAPDTLLSILRFALDDLRRNPTLPRLVIADLLSMAAWNPEEAIPALREALGELPMRSQFDPPVVPPTLILAVWYCLCQSTGEDLPAKEVQVLHTVLGAMIDIEAYDEWSLAFVDRVGPLLYPNDELDGPVPATHQKKKKKKEDPRLPDPRNVHTPARLWEAFRLLEQLTFGLHHEHALRLFNHLVTVGWIPAYATPSEEFTASVAAVAAADEEGGNVDARTFSLLVISTIAQASLYYGASALGTSLVQRLISIAPPKGLYLVARDVSQILILCGSEDDASVLAQLLTSLAAHLRPGAAALPDSVLWQFYDLCTTLCRPDLMHDVYQGLAANTAGHEYPPPQGDALVFLLVHYRQTGQQGLALDVVRRVVRFNYRIHPTVRAAFISECAELGFALEARTVYERYERWKGVAATYGSRRMVVQLVKLFTRRAAHLLNTPAHHSQPPDQARAQAEDMLRFAHVVTARFAHVKGPPASMHHHDLSVLAACHFRLDALPDAFDTMAVLLRKGVVPDQHDVSIVLSAAARYSARGAMRLCEEAVARGLSPNQVVYTSILHHALLQDDGDLADDLLRKARARGVQMGDAHTMDQLLRALVHSVVPRAELGAPSTSTSTPTPGPEGEDRLHRALHVLRDMRRNGYDVPLATATLCARVALQAAYPWIAFAFWDAGMKGRYGGDDYTACAVEVEVMRGVQRARWEGRYDAGKARGIVGRLRGEGVVVGRLGEEEVRRRRGAGRERKRGGRGEGGRGLHEEEEEEEEEWALPLDVEPLGKRYAPPTRTDPNSGFDIPDRTEPGPDEDDEDEDGDGEEWTPVDIEAERKRYVAQKMKELERRELARKMGDALGGVGWAGGDGGGRGGERPP